MQLSLAAYSFRNYFRFMKGKTHKFEEPEMTMYDFIDFCANHHCAGTELTSYFFPADADANYFKKIKQHAANKKIAISGSAVGNNFSLPHGEARNAQITYVKEWIDNSKIMGAPHIRIFAGKEPKGMSADEADRLVVEALIDCCEYAGRHRIKLGLENHDSIGNAERLIGLIDKVKSPWLGINLDSGNFRTKDPYKDFERCAPYAVNVQLKVELQPLGGKKEPADLKRLVKLLRQAKYDGFVALEYEAKENPYEAVPGILKEIGKLL